MQNSSIYWLIRVIYSAICVWPNITEYVGHTGHVCTKENAYLIIYKSRADR